MDAKQAELLAHLQATFRVEADEHLDTISRALRELERGATHEAGLDLLEAVFRSVHSLKGSGRVVGYSLIEYVCQALEECLSQLRTTRILPGREVLDLLQETSDTVMKILTAPDPNAPPTALKATVLTLRQRLETVLGTMNSSSVTAAEPAEKSVTSSPPTPDLPCAGRETNNPKIEVETVRIPVDRLDRLLAQAEEMIFIKLVLRQHLHRLKTFGQDLEEFRNYLPHSGVAAAERSPLRSLARIEGRITAHRRASGEDFRLASGMIENLIADAKNLFLFPLSSLQEPLGRLSRDLARELGKEVDFQFLGGEVELDRRIIQELKDPLIHILRNALDHGVETPGERLAVGKLPRATVRISAAIIENGRVEIVVSDDGQGIDLPQVKAAAAAEGHLGEDAAGMLDAEQTLQLIFRSGISTRTQVTTISGRGLGMAIVEERLDKLGGDVAVTTTPGGGTEFRLTVPVSLATIRGIQLRVGDRRFAIPTNQVRKVCRLPESAVKTVETRETVLFEERTVPIVSVAAILGLPGSGSSGGFRTAMIIGDGDRQVAFEVDEIVSEEELLVKGLGSLLKRVPHISGATVLGTGMVVPILNAGDLFKSAAGGRVHFTAVRDEPTVTPQEHRARRILVVDDSITSRTLLKNVLESYGYEVRTACDGSDALSLLQTEEFDLVSSDVEMPQMDGFELTSRIRASERLARMPVVLVTGLESAEHKKKGIDAGADAYIVKSSFDQSNLLDIIRKLL